MGVIIAFIAILVLLAFPALRCALCHPVAVPKYGAGDLYKYIKYKVSDTCNDQTDPQCL